MWQKSEEQMHTEEQQPGAARTRAPDEDRRQSPPLPPAMIGMVSHEIRTPLQTLVVAIDTLERMVPRDPARAAAFEAQLQRMRRAVERIAQCVDSMSGYALSANEISRQPAQAELVDVAAVMAELAAESSTRSAAPIEVRIGANVPARLEVDRARLSQILENYLANATNYATKNAIKCDAAAGHIVLAAQALGEPQQAGGVRVVEFSVADHGPGVEPDEAERIWEPFYRSGSARSQPGSGLGLAVVRLLAERAGWEVGCRSGDAGGACFFVVVPVPGR
jgi:signal transduction histidine kinase